MVLEEAFSIFHVDDWTSTLQEKGYVASYNVPKNNDIYDKLYYQECTHYFILDPYTYENDPRAD